MVYMLDSSLHPEVQQVADKIFVCRSGSAADTQAVRVMLMWPNAMGWRDLVGFTIYDTFVCYFIHLF